MLFSLLNFLGIRFEKKEREAYGGVIETSYKYIEFKFLPFNWMILVFVVYVSLEVTFGSWFVLDKSESGSVENFGKYIRTEGPGGLQFKVPFISARQKVSTETRYRMELGFRTIEGTNPAKYDSVPEESIMLTRGGHIASVYWIIQYTIDDVYNWLYQVAEPTEVLKLLAQGSMRLTIGKTYIDDILTTKKEEIQKGNKELLQSYCDIVGFHVTINEVKLQDCSLPDKRVQDAYNNVMNAIKNKEKTEKDALGYANTKIPEANGKASAIINDANAYYSQTVNDAEGEVARFMGLYNEYKKDPQTTAEKLWYEALQEVMPGAKKTIIQQKSLINLKNL